MFAMDAPLRSSRRTSFADEQGSLLELLIPPNPGPEVQPDAQVCDAPGEHTVNFGIIRIGCLYGIYVPLPGCICAEAIHPLPPGLTCEAKYAEDGTLSLWLMYEVISEGRHHESFKVRLEGVAELPELTVHVKAQVMSRRDGRPSRTNIDVHVLRLATPEVTASEVSAGQEWQAAKEYLQTAPDEECETPH